MKLFLASFTLLVSASAYSQSNHPTETRAEGIERINKKCENKIRNIIPQEKKIEASEVSLKNAEEDLVRNHNSGTKFKSDGYVNQLLSSRKELEEVSIPKAKNQVKHEKNKLEKMIQNAKAICKAAGVAESIGP